MSQYISLKSDTSSKRKTQSLSNGIWVTIEAGGITKLVPNATTKTGAFWGAYLNITTPKIGGASQIVIKWVRDAARLDDATGYETISLNKGGTTYVKDLWLFQAKKGQPVTFQVKANGKATIGTRELKLSIL